MAYCRYANAPQGCALDTYCPRTHVGRGDGSAADAEMDRLRADHSRIPRWFWRENVSGPAAAGRVAWRPLNDAYAATMEASLRAGETDLVVGGRYKVSLSEWFMCDAQTGGARRPLQRVLVSDDPQWFATRLGVASVLPIQLAVSVARQLETEFASGLHSFFGLRAGPFPAWINLETMLMIELEAGTTYALHRQPITLVPGGGAADMYGEPRLLHHGSYRDAGNSCGGSTLFVCAPRSLHAEHVEVNPCVISGNIELSPQPAGDICAGIKCHRRVDPLHLRLLRHHCWLGRSADCFLTTTDGPRAALHNRMFVHIDGEPAEPPPDEVTAWRQRQRSLMPLRKTWRQALHAEDKQSHTRVDAASPEHTVIAQALLGSQDDASPIHVALQLTRIHLPKRYQRYLRWRNSVQQLWAREQPDAAEAVDEEMLLLPTDASESQHSFEPLGAPLPRAAFREWQAAVDAAQARGGPSATPAVAVVMAYTGPSGADNECNAVAPSVRAAVQTSEAHCLVNTAVPSGRGVVYLTDHCQWHPMYVAMLPRRPVDS